MGGEKSSIRFAGLFFFFVLISCFSTLAQIEDSDADGIVDGIDACSKTNTEEGLPIQVRYKEYLGCACSQIYEMTGDNYCLDVFCSSQRPLLIDSRSYSSRETSCSEDYCVNSTLFDYPVNIQVACFDGKEQTYDCTPKIVENSQECINGTIRQYEPENENNYAESFGVLLDDYEKMQLRVFRVSSENEIRTVLGISGEELLRERMKLTMNSLRIDKHVKNEKRVIVNSEKIVAIKKITIYPDRFITMYDVFVFEELPRGSEIELKEVIPGMEVVYQDEGPVLLVWKIDKISDKYEITYQVNRPFEGESNTIVIAKEIKNSSWMLALIPLALILIFIGIFMYVSAKSVPRRKRIFKE
jgi:hypothetical protein